MTPLFLSGPHGGGKTTLTKALLAQSSAFIENGFDIDFTTDFPSLSSLSHFERCLMRLYHRFFITNYARTQAITHPEQCIITNRSVYDSEAYINVYRDLHWISEAQFQKLDLVLKNFQPRPATVVLNPPVEVIKQRLQGRRSAATRVNRDTIFANEDSDEFIERLHGYFASYKNQENILYLENNSQMEQNLLLEWTYKNSLK